MEGKDSIEYRSLYERKIIHFDMDAFYASVEIRDDPSLMGKPVVIGGSPQSRAVVCTASYEARKFGVHSAIPCSKAFRLCPDAIFISPDFRKYKTASEKVHEIFRDYTEQIEPLSLDEAFLDVSQDPKGRYAFQIAKEIQDRIWEELRLTGSAGVAPNKMIAKIASDFRKPFGITVIQPHEVKEFVGQLSLRTIPGIGPSSQKKLASLGYSLCADIWQSSREKLIDQLGENMGNWIYWRARGIDHRQVQTHRERKSISMERTFAKDIQNIEEIEAILRLQVDELVSTLKKKETWGRTWTLKVKYADFKQVTRSQSKDISPHQGNSEMYSLFEELLAKTDAGKQKIRLIGAGCSNLCDLKEEEEEVFALLS